MMKKLLRYCNYGILTLALSALATPAALADGIQSDFFEIGSKAEYQNQGAYLGVQVQTVTDELVTRFDLRTREGVYVGSVVDASPAEDAGVHPGDVIVEYNYQSITSAGELVELVASGRSGDEVILFVNRNGIKKRLVTNLTERPEEKTSRIERLDRKNNQRFEGERRRSHRQDNDRPNNFHFRVQSSPFIGVSLQSISGQLANYFAVPGDAGALIIETLEGSPAEDAGFKAGDVVIAADDIEIEVTEDLQRVVRDKESGQKIEITVIRNKRKTNLIVTVAEREATSSKSGAPRIFGFAPGKGFAPGNDANGHNFGKKMRKFKSADKRERGFESAQLPDVLYSRTKEKNQRINNLELKIKELQEQIDNLHNKSDE